MSMPSIDDVKAAIERITLYTGKDHASYWMGGCVYDGQEDAATLVNFALAVLNAPGMTTERLAEIQRQPLDDHPDYWGINPSYAVKELLTEVLWLRTVQPVFFPFLDKHQRAQLERSWQALHNGPSEHRLITMPDECIEDVE